MGTRQIEAPDVLDGVSERSKNLLIGDFTRRSIYCLNSPPRGFGGQRYFVIRIA
jgi:hypothetical protein